MKPSFYTKFYGTENISGYSLGSITGVHSTEARKVEGSTPSPDIHSQQVCGGKKDLHQPKAKCRGRNKSVSTPADTHIVGAGTTARLPRFQSFFYLITPQQKPINNYKEVQY